MSRHAVPAIFAKRIGRETNAPTTLFDMNSMSNVPVDLKADPAITLVGSVERKSISGLLV